MIRSQLQDYRGDDPTWGFIAQLGAEQFTGEVVLGTATRVHLYVDEGSIYFAEREGDAPVQSRLVVRGALSPAQLARGGVFLDGTVSLARLFTRESSIDRHEVETALERLTQEVLDEVGTQPAGQVQLVPLRHHETGIHEWARRIQPPVVRTASPLTTPAAPVAPRPIPAPLTIAPLTLSPAAPLSVPEAAPAPGPSTPTAPLTIPATPFDAPTAESPFSVPPVPATAAPLPAPPAMMPTPLDPPEPAAVVEREALVEPDAPAAAVDEVPTESTAPELPKLSARVMSVAEITAAHAVITGETPPEEATDRFTPTDFSSLQLPKLATKVMSVAELTAKLDTAAAPTEEAQEEVATKEPDTAHAPAGATSVFDSGPVQAIDAAPLPSLPTLHMGPAQGLTESPTTEPPAAEVEVAKERVVEPIAPWATPEQNLAAVEIWEMVDTLLADGHDDADLVSAGGATAAKGGRWRRGRKG